MSDYQGIRNRLLARHEEVRQRLTRVSTDLRHAESPLNQILDEQSLELENDEVLEALGGSMRVEIERIERTIGQLDRGEYGVCESCHRAIPLRRLEAFPFTTHCVECAAERESGAEAPRRRVENDGE